MRTSSLATGRFSTTTSSSVTGTLTSSSPISASAASPSTGTRSTVTSSRLVGTSILWRSVTTRLRTLRAPASLSRVPALPELFFAPLYSQLVLVVEVAPRLGYALSGGVVLAELSALGVAHRHAGVLLTVIITVSTAFLGALHSLQPVVGVDLVLKLGGDLPVVVEGGAVFGLGLLHRDDYASALVVGAGHHAPGDEGGARAEEAHLDAYVLRVILLVHEVVVHLADLLAIWVVDLVTGEAVL